MRLPEVVSADADLAGYVAARWPHLVHTLVLLGCPERLAADVALDALARCQRGWTRTAAEADVDEVVRSELVAAWERRRSAREPWWDDALDPSTQHASTQHAASSESSASEVWADLDRRTSLERSALVLERFAGMSGGAFTPVGSQPGPAEEQLRSAVAQVPVLAPPTVAEITGRRRQDSRRRSRRSLRLGLAALVPLAVVAAGLTWLADRGPSSRPADDLARLTVTAAENPTNVVWAAGGVLHLPHGTVAVPVLRQVAPLGTGAVYADREGRVVQLADNGVRTVLGREDPDIGFVSSDARGWVAWVDPTGRQRQVVVVDVTSHRVIGRVAATDGSRPTAIDQDTVFLSDRVGIRGWQPLREAKPAAVVEPAVLVAASSSTRVYQSAQTKLQVFPYADVKLLLTGVGGRLSTDGRLLVTRTSGGAGGNGPVAIYDALTGDVLQTGVAHDELAIDATLGPDLTVTYLIARKVDRPQANDQLRASFAGALQLRTCHLYLADVPPQCELVTDLPVSGISPQLAH